MKNELVLFRHDHIVHSDFFAARYPVSRADYAGLAGGPVPGPGGEGLVMKATLAEALRYCNLLSAAGGLPPAYLEADFLLANEKGEKASSDSETRGFRLLNRNEWQQAAMGALKGERVFGGGAYLDILNRHFYLKNWEHAPGGCEELAGLELNPAGLAGMLRPDREWSGDTCSYGARSFRACGWAESVDRADKFYLAVQDFEAAPETRLCFRVGRTAG